MISFLYLKRCNIRHSGCSEAETRNPVTCLIPLDSRFRGNDGEKLFIKTQIHFQESLLTEMDQYLKMIISGVLLSDSENRAQAIIKAMESIESDYENLRGVLPKSEYHELDNQVLGQLLRTLNPDKLRQVSGDVFGRIYEYFLTQFADQKAHDGAEFFTREKSGLIVDRSRKGVQPSDDAFHSRTG